LIKTYAATPKQVATAIKADTTQRRRNRALQAQIDKLRGKTIEIIMSSGSPAAKPRGRAGGAAAQCSTRPAGICPRVEHGSEGSRPSSCTSRVSQVQVLTAAVQADARRRNHIVINLPACMTAVRGACRGSMLEKFVARRRSITVGRGIR